MNIPESLRTALASAGDEYLVGLSNKGTLNRAKKDLAALNPTAEAGGELVVVTMGDATCMLKAPLGESMCSCPSTSMCRHRIAAILWLRDQAGAPEEVKPKFTSLKAYPSEKLAKQLGQKRLAGILFRHRSGKGPEIQADQTIRVVLPWHPQVVRLLEPMEHSTCSCHSRNFCNHKAEALLYWQLREGIVKPEALEPETPDGPDPEQTRGVCEAVCQMLSEQLGTGLSRMPSAVADTVERMAALSHTAKLPSMERALRNLHGEYAAYFSHSATFREGELLDRVGRAWRLASRMAGAGEEELTKLAGSFREEYERVADLKLYLLGFREYVGRSGYGGTIYYFLERNTHEFYTYRDLRPDYYEKKRRGPEVTLWDLPCTLKRAWNCAMDLSAPKVNDSGGLSATKDCKATLLGSAKPWLVVPGNLIFEDFEGLVEKSAPNLLEQERLVVVKPKYCQPKAFDHVNQVWSMELTDKNGRDILAEVWYQSKEAPVIKALEDVAKRVDMGLSAPVFFGEVYREGDRIKLYPIEVYEEWGERT